MSSGDIEAKATVSLETGKFRQGSNEVQTELDKMKQKGKATGDGVGDSFDKMGNKGKEAGDKINAGGEKAKQGLDKASSGATKADAAMTTLAVSVVGLGSSFGAVIQKSTDFEKKAVALSKTMLGLETQTIAVNRQMEDLAQAVKDGTITGRDYERKVQDIALAQKALQLESKNIKAEQQAINAEYANFGLQIGQTALLTFTSLKSIQTILAAKNAATTATQVAQTSAVAADTGVKATNIGVTGGVALATGGAAVAQGGFTASIYSSIAAIRAQTAAMLASPMAPFAIAAIAAGTAFTVYETNAFGARDAIEDLTGSERGSFPTLTGTIQNAFGATKEATTAMTDFKNVTVDYQALVEQGALTQEEANELIRLNSEVVEQNRLAKEQLIETEKAHEERLKSFQVNLSGVTTEFGNTSNAILQFNQQLQGAGVNDLENRVKALQLSISQTNFDPLSANFKLAKAAILPEIEDIAEGLEVAFGSERTDEFLANMGKLGILVSDDMKKIQESIRGVNKEIDETKKNFNDLANDLSLDEIGLQIATNFNLRGINNLIRLANEAFDDGDLDRAREIEKQIQLLGRGTSSKSGHIKSIQDQLKEFTARAANLRTIIRGGRAFTTTIGRLSNILSHEQIGHETFKSAFRRNSASGTVAQGGHFSAGRRARDRNPRGRQDKLGERLRQKWVAYLNRWTVPIGGKSVRAIDLANLAGVDIPMPQFMTFGNNANLDKDVKGKMIADDFNKKISLTTFGFSQRVADFQFLADFLPDKFDSIEAMARTAFSGANGRFANANSFNKPNPVMDKLVREVIDEINAGSEILGFDTSQESKAMEDLIKRRDELQQRINNALDDPASIFRESGGQVTISDLQRSLQGLDRQIRRGKADREAMDFFKNNRDDFRNMIRFNERLGRTGTRESVTDEENFERDFLSGLGFLSENVDMGDTEFVRPPITIDTSGRPIKDFPFGGRRPIDFPFRRRPQGDFRFDQAVTFDDREQLFSHLN